MSEKRQTVTEMQETFRIFVDAEGGRIPFYARLSRCIAEDPALAGILLEAPRGQRLPVLLLAALHDVVLGDPDTPLGRWYPSVTGRAPLPDDPDEALHRTVEEHWADILSSVRHRRVQTNEVNRCTAWMLGLAELCQDDRRRLSLVEVGASAGLNLRLDDYAYTIARDGDTDVSLGRSGSTVQLGTELRTGRWPGLQREIPAVAERIGIDLNPLNVREPDDARWLRACVWPEQQERFERLDAALALAQRDPVALIVGDMVHSLADVIDRAPLGTHVVVLMSWVLAYVGRDDRELFGQQLTEAAARVSRGGGRLTLLSMEADAVLPWLAPPPLPDTADADLKWATILSATSFDSGSPDAAALGRCQAHVSWMDRLA